MHSTFDTFYPTFITFYPTFNTCYLTFITFYSTLSHFHHILPHFTSILSHFTPLTFNFECFVLKQTWLAKCCTVHREREQSNTYSRDMMNGQSGPSLSLIAKAIYQAIVVVDTLPCMRIAGHIIQANSIKNWPLLHLKRNYLNLNRTSLFNHGQGLHVPVAKPGLLKTIIIIYHHLLYFLG